MSKPLTNPITSRAKVLTSKMKLKNRFSNAKKSYGGIGTSQEWKDLSQRQQRRKYAIRDNYNNKRKKGANNHAKRRSRKNRK